MTKSVKRKSSAKASAPKRAPHRIFINIRERGLVFYFHLLICNAHSNHIVLLRTMGNHSLLFPFAMKVFKLKPNKKEALLAWGKELSTIRREAARTECVGEEIPISEIYDLKR